MANTPTKITIEEITDGSVVTNNDIEVWEGTGILDVLLHTVNENLGIQYRSGRIDGNDYANVYLGSLQTLVAESLAFLLQREQAQADIDIKRKQLEIEDYRLKEILPKEAYNLCLQGENLDEERKLKIAQFELNKLQGNILAKENIIKKIEQQIQQKQDAILRRQLPENYTPPAITDDQEVTIVPAGTTCTSP